MTQRRRGPTKGVLIALVIFGSIHFLKLVLGDQPTGGSAAYQLGYWIATLLFVGLGVWAGSRLYRGIYVGAPVPAAAPVSYPYQQAHAIPTHPPTQAAVAGHQPAAAPLATHVQPPPQHYAPPQPPQHYAPPQPPQHYAPPQAPQHYAPPQAPQHYAPPQAPQHYAPAQAPQHYAPPQPPAGPGHPRPGS